MFSSGMLSTHEVIKVTGTKWGGHFEWESRLVVPEKTLPGMLLVT